MRKRDNKFYPLIYAVAGFVYTALAGVIDFFANPNGNPWINLCFVIPSIVFSVFTIVVCIKNIKKVNPKDIYIPPIVFSVLFLIASYGFTLIYPEMFLRNSYLSVLIMYPFTALCILIITIIPKIPRKRFVILSYIGVIILAFYGIACAVYNCFVTFGLNGSILNILLTIRENIIG